MFLGLFFSKHVLFCFVAPFIGTYHNLLRQVSQTVVVGTWWSLNYYFIVIHTKQRPLPYSVIGYPTLNFIDSQPATDDVLPVIEYPWTLTCCCLSSPPFTLYWILFLMHFMRGSLKRRHLLGTIYLTWAYTFMNQIRFVCLVGGGTKSFLCHDIKAAKRWKGIFVHHKADLHIVILQESFIWTGGKTGKQGAHRKSKPYLWLMIKFLYGFDITTAIKPRRWARTCFGL